MNEQRNWKVFTFTFLSSFPKGTLVSWTTFLHRLKLRNPECVCAEFRKELSSSVQISVELWTEQIPGIPGSNPRRHGVMKGTLTSLHIPLFFESTQGHRDRVGFRYRWLICAYEVIPTGKHAGKLWRFDCKLNGKLQFETVLFMCCVYVVHDSAKIERLIEDKIEVSVIRSELPLCFTSRSA